MSGQQPIADRRLRTFSYLINLTRFILTPAPPPPLPSIMLVSNLQTLTAHYRSGSIMVTTLDCGPGGSWFESRSSGCQYSMWLDRLHRAYPSLHPFGVVHWVPVLSNIKTATGCESNRQLQL